METPRFLSALTSNSYGVSSSMFDWPNNSLSLDSRGREKYFPSQSEDGWSLQPSLTFKAHPAGQPLSNVPGGHSKAFYTGSQNYSS